MKLVSYIICLLVMSLSMAHAKQGNRYKYPLSRMEESLMIQNALEIKNIESKELLKTVKYFMINGQLDKAKVLLKDATITNDFSKRTQYRYLAMINFIEGNHQNVVDILNSKEMSVFTLQSKFCQMNILSHIIINKMHNLKEKWHDCHKVTISKSKSNLIWFKTIVDLKLQNSKNVIRNTFKDVSVDNLTGDNLRIFLKLSLYLNKQDVVIPRFEYFNKETLQDSMFRELIGMNYFRNMELVKAFQLLDGLDSPNAEVFKGNLYLMQKKFDSAFAQYKLALQKKDNSDNALERLIPLSWQLAQWDEGIEYVKRFSYSPKDIIKKNTLLAAFHTMSGDNESAKKIIKQILSKTNKSIPVELNQVMTYNSILYDDKYPAQTAAMSSCLKKDGLHCWFLFFNTTWESPTKILKQDKVIHEESNSLLSLYTESDINNPIIEEVFVNQKDIEELDNELIKLIEVK